ncbi:MAG: FAD-dependent oxidoreductase [Verrucomicrobia subdivision 3 bacterium]|nr:FAD-dependent oxidoreductase [Limisphaerales bacterium]
MSRRVVVIGAGVIGLCSAYYAARRGRRVTVIDRAPAEHDGCSFGNAGMIAPSHFVPLAAPGMVARGLKWMWNPRSPFYIKPRLDWDLISWGLKFWRAATAEHVRRSAPVLRDLHLASRACFEEFADVTGNAFGLVKRGLLMLCKEPHAFHEEAATAEEAGRLGMPAEVLDSKQAQKLDPGIRMDIAGAIYFPLDCHLSPNRFMSSLAEQLAKLGATFIWNAEVTEWRTSAAIVHAVTTPQGEVDADEFVLCAGSWSQAITRDLGLKVPLQAGKGYSLTLPKPHQLPEICAILTEARIAVTPIGQSLRFGGTMEIAGLNEDITPARVQGIIEAVPKYYPDFTPADFAGVKPWRGLRPCSPDGLPYLGRTKNYSNLIIATGHAMMGLSLGPITGKIVAEILSDERPSIDISLLNPDRYS